MFMQHFWSEEWRRKTHQSFGLIDEIVEFCRPVRTALLFFPNSFGEKTDDRITLLARKGAHVGKAGGGIFVFPRPTTYILGILSNFF